MEGPIEVTVTEWRCTDCEFLRKAWGGHGYHCASERIGTATDAAGSVPLMRWICMSTPVRTPAWCPVLERDKGGE